MAGRDPELVYIDDADASPPETADEALNARITLRLPESLKTRLEAAAAAHRVSANTWLVQALTRAVEPRSTVSRGRHRLTGYGRN